MCCPKGRIFEHPCWSDRGTEFACTKFACFDLKNTRTVTNRTLTVLFLAGNKNKLAINLFKFTVTLFPELTIFCFDMLFLVVVAVLFVCFAGFSIGI